ncbi:MAG: carboxypeptidase-like regulatory domain-containing protein [candidate division WOR-3 bacterium]|nr:carboxypeptidase-like regulatory domain-containing protein [candidate division WOR-3 bacterium]MDW8113603.1 carboxypeptidase-like regulatory domain-containing protein [candidate division WOR-3 bacterium]
MLILFLILFLFSCSPERENIYDPKSKYYKNTGTLLGYVFDNKEIKIKDAEITIFGERKKNLLITKTDNNGFFQFVDIPLDSYLISIYKENYQKLNYYKKINNHQIETLYFRLNPLPYLKSCQIRSYYEERYILPESLSFNITCEIFDENLKEVYLLLPTNDTFYLNHLRNQIYERTITKEMVNGNFDDLVGKSFLVYLISNFSDTLIYETSPLIRIIRELPQQISPINGEITSFKPTLIFSQPPLYFSYTYFIKIYYLLNNRFPILCYQDSLIPKEDTVFFIEDSLIDGLYLWRVGIKDEFGNRALSKEALFEVIGKKLCWKEKP